MMFNVYDPFYRMKKDFIDMMKKDKERIIELEEALDKSFQMLDNTLRELKELKDLLITNPQPAKEKGLYPWHRKD